MLMITLRIAAAALGLVLGAAVLLRRNGTASHKRLGRAWVALMLVVALSSFWILEIRNGAGLGALAPGRTLYALFFA